MLSSGSVQLFGSCALWLGFSAFAWGAQTSGIGSRDRPAVGDTKWAAIEGRVIDGASGQPVRRAIVSLPGSKTVPDTRTDADGIFRFPKVPPGSYVVRATKAGYLTGSFPAATGMLRGRALQFGSGERRTDLKIALMRGSVVQGRVVDEHGDPVERASVTAWLVGRRAASRPVVRGVTSTNDAGEFRLSRLPPGTYQLTAVLRSAVEIEDSNLGLIGPDFASAPTVTVQYGETVNGLDLVLREVPQVRVSGRVMNAEGTPASSATVRAQRVLPDGRADLDGASSTSTRNEGVFTLSLLPGDYVLKLTSVTVDNYARVLTQHGSHALTVSGNAIPDLILQTERTGAISGRLTLPMGTAWPKRSTRPTVQLRSATDRPGSCAAPGRGTIRTDWKFDVRGVWGDCVLRISSLPPGWAVRSITLQGKDVTDRPLDVRGGRTVEELTVELTTAAPTLQLHVTDQRGNPTVEYVALVFSTDPNHWNTDSRLFKVAVPSADGSRSGAVSLAAAGDYYVVALSDVFVDQLNEPGFLEALVPSATPVSVPEGATATLQLRLFAGDR